jgi:tRNA pseudouridine38-40 synthase
VQSAQWFEERGEWVFEISADRFLRNMVRAIVGTLLEIGQVKRDETDLQAVLASEDRRKAGESAPAHGLFLHSVEYPQEIFDTGARELLHQRMNLQEKPSIDA